MQNNDSWTKIDKETTTVSRDIVQRLMATEARYYFVLNLKIEPISARIIW